MTERRPIQRTLEGGAAWLERRVAKLEQEKAATTRVCVRNLHQVGECDQDGIPLPEADLLPTGWVCLGIFLNWRSGPRTSPHGGLPHAVTVNRNSKLVFACNPKRPRDLHQRLNKSSSLRPIRVSQSGECAQCRVRPPGPNPYAVLENRLKGLSHQSMQREPCPGFRK